MLRTIRLPLGGISRPRDKLSPFRNRPNPETSLLRRRSTQCYDARDRPMEATAQMHLSGDCVYPQIPDVPPKVNADYSLFNRECTVPADFIQAFIFGFLPQ